MTWRAYLLETMTGLKGQQLDITGGSVGIELNAIEDIPVTASRASLDGVAPHWWAPWSGGVLVTWEDEWIEETPIAAGPITRPLTENITAGTVGIQARGIGAVLERRQLLAQDFRPGDEAALASSVCAWSGLDLGSIIGRIVTAATSKRNGWLPISVPADRAGTRQRTDYEGWNLANNQVWKRIMEITEVIGGPDVMLRPRWADEARTRIEWVLATGTEAQPAIAQDRTVLWDTTAEKSPVARLDVASDASRLTHRAYATGAGEGAGTAVRIAEVAQIPERMPLLETVVTDSDTEDGDLLAGKAAGALSTQALDQLSLQVVSTDVSPIGSWHVGDEAQVVTQGRLHVPDGEHLLRIIAAKYDLGSSAAQVECQPERLGEELTW